ncbi:MAG TPA: HNH endonuclease [bacterium]|nr:HNH endonuclease [bacterium]
MSLCLCGCGSETNPGKKYIGIHWAKCEKYRRNQKTIMKRLCNEEEYKNKVSKQVQENWDHNEGRKLEMSKRLKEKWKSKKERKKQSQMMLRVWENEAHRNKQSEGMSKSGVSEKISLGGAKRRGLNNGAWNGGTGCAPYSSIWGDSEFKESIKERDNFECKHSDCWGKSKILVLHHINYIKEDCNPDNLITLCNSCNMRVNVNREYWTEYFSDILKKNMILKTG